ncbi:MAG: FecR domain-containing protein [Tannerellaceae bacterium]|jgi:ferric-dicitrate binding protein FerR (iron transport regulator)|nr:FecR domain-containing protein [Tannerellaceae bacterium]
MMIAELLARYITGDVSLKEKEYIQQWIEASEENRKEFMRLRILYDMSLAHEQGQEQEQTLSQSGKPAKRIFLELAKIAAIICITFGCSYYFLSHSLEKEDEVAMQTLHIPAGQRAELTLTDGTKVWLNALTTLTFPNRFTKDSREVYLDGEAYFDVSHNAGKIFTVNTSRYLVNVYGTEFNVSAYSRNDLFETALMNGSVEVVALHDTQKIRLSPGRQVYLKDGKLVSDSILDYNHFLWKKGVISFEHERMEDILVKLRLYYDIAIENKNATINNMRYTGKFYTKDGVEHVLNVLKIPTKLRFTKDNENNIIHIY